MNGSVLIIDDDAAFRFAMAKALRRGGYSVSEASSGEEAVEVLCNSSPPDVALLDLKMKGIGGLEVLRRCGSIQTNVIVLTGHGTVKAAVEAMQLGAFSFLEKPVDAQMLQPLLRQALLERGAAAAGEAGEPIPLIGVSAMMEEVRQFVRTVAPTNETVLVFGETGTGKEVVARQIHAQSGRSSGPFVAMNAACVPRELFESELFGHKRGAFTGAHIDRAGLFREADGGTLFIDELAELPLESQAKLLRAIETKMIRPVGESGEVEVDVRIVAATNRDLWAETQAGRFREDLYFRLQVFPVLVRPLRERPEDVEGLAAHLLQRLGKAEIVLEPEALGALREYDWPGNVRELLNVLRRAALFSISNKLGADLVRRMIAASVFGSARESTPPTGPASQTNLAALEREHIERVLQEMDGNITKAASALGIDRRTLQRKLRSYGIE
ncbi:MAG: sigma-54 dependent transcriptional regulator [Myxococcales bacterium]|nr:sigma-54 dependent transcriptional regulator [Myxococcales bacterium]MDH3482616.1 sigma-54 dependent transcriptional regulator [Myxococcales bacterium]